MIKHIPVLPKETIQYLAPSQDKNFIDATTGFGGHTKEILTKTGPDGRVLAIDQDPVALAEAKKNLKNFSPRVTFVNSNFSELGLIVRQWPYEIHGILFDLGVSTYQLKSPERGFSFSTKEDSELDMRMSPHLKISAQDIVNKWNEKELRYLLRSFGEEPYAGKIARQIVEARRIQPIQKTSRLVEIIKNALPPEYRLSRKKHFATSTFRAIRMAVNHELENLESGLKQAWSSLAPNGRLVVISFHSLEDRIVKNFFREQIDAEILTPKPITPTVEEVEENQSARSAKLRAIKKL